MKHGRRFFLFTLAFVTLPFLVGTQSWATNFSEQDTDGAPFGFSVDGNAKGTKLSGVIAVNFSMTVGGVAGDVDTAFFTIRLRQGNDNNIRALAGHIDETVEGDMLNLLDQGAIQDAILRAIGPWVGGQFGFGTDHPTILVKSIENQADTRDCEGCPPELFPITSQVSDIVLAVTP